MAMPQSSMDSDRLSSAGISTHSSGTAGTVGGSVVGVRVGDQNHKRGDEDDYNLGPLPPMWEKAFTPTGEAYFIDHNTGTSHWLDPRLARVRKHSLGECGEDELPYGWERVTDERYGSYYVDHINRRTQYENPVLQAKRLRAEKMAAENGAPSQHQQNGSTPTGELRGERFTVELTKGTQGLGFTLIGAEGIPETDGYLQIRSIMPHSPAWVDGALRPGDVLVGVGARGVRGLSHAQVAQIFQSIAPGTDVSLHVVRGYPLSYDCADPHTRVLSTLAVDARAPPDASAMRQLTRALRTRFNLDSPNDVDQSASRDETDTSPVAPHSPGERRLMSRSFDLDELAPSEQNPAPRCSSADHLLSLATEPTHRNSRATSEPGQELVLTLRRGAAGFGFTIADSVHGQKVKKVLDRSRCAGLREGDLLLQIGEHDVSRAPHLHVVQVLKDCPALHETRLRVWRRNNAARAPRSRSATRVQPSSSNAAAQLNSRSKTPTAEQLRSPALHAHNQNSLDRLNGLDSVEATYAVPEHKSRERESLIDRRRRSSTPGGRLTLPVVTPWTEPQNEQWNERETWIDNSNNVRNWAETQKWDNNNEQKWDQNGQKWDQNGQKWDQNGQKWDQNRQKWDQNEQKWDQNEQKWDQNGQKWDQNGQKWDQNGQKWDQNGQKWDQNGQKWEDGANGNGWDARGGRWGSDHWGEVSTPTVHVDMGAAYWRGNASVADSSDNGGFPEDGMLHSPTTAAIGGLARQSPSSRHRPHSPSNSGRLRSHSPSTNSATDRLLANSPSNRLQSHSPSNNSSNGRIKVSPMRLRESSPPRHMHSPISRRSPSCYETDSAQPNTVYVTNYPQVEAGGTADPEADVLVRLARGSAGFGFRIVGGTEDGSRVAVGYVVPGGPADGLLRPGDLLTSVDGIPLAGATHARAVAYVCQAASRGHVTLGVRHNRADIQALGLPTIGSPHTHQPLLATETGLQPVAPGGYGLVPPAPLYPPHLPHPHHIYGAQYESSVGWAPAPYEVTVTRAEGEGFGFVVISSTNKATSTIGQLIPNSPAARCGLLNVGDTILAINRLPIRNLPHPEVVALIKHSGTTVTLTVLPPDGRVD